MPLLSVDWSTCSNVGSHDLKLSKLVIPTLLMKVLKCRACCFLCHNNQYNNELLSRIVFATFALVIIVFIYYQAWSDKFEKLKFF